MRFEVRRTPKHGIWLDKAEIKVGCLMRRNLPASSAASRPLWARQAADMARWIVGDSIAESPDHSTMLKL